MFLHSLAAVGDMDNMFPIECPVMFHCDKQLGRNITYNFDFGYVDEQGERQIGSQWTGATNETYHQFVMPKGMCAAFCPFSTGCARIKFLYFS